MCVILWYLDKFYKSNKTKTLIMLYINSFFPQSVKKNNLKECKAVDLHVNFCCFWCTKVSGKPSQVKAEVVLGTWASFLQVQYWSIFFTWLGICPKKKKKDRWMTNMAESEESEYFTCFLSCWPLYSYLLRQCPFISVDKKPSMALAAS